MSRCSIAEAKKIIENCIMHLEAISKPIVDVIYYVSEEDIIFISIPSPNIG